MVVSMRPMTPENAEKAKEITDKYPNVHGGPVQIGNPEAIGIMDINKPDYGDSVEIREERFPYSGLAALLRRRQSRMRSCPL